MGTINLQSKRVVSVPDNGDTIIAEIYYNRGGMNYFSGKVDPRGYWLSYGVGSVGDPTTVLRVTDSKAFRAVIAAAKRYSASTHRKYMDALMKLPAEQIIKWYKQKPSLESIRQVLGGEHAKQRT